MLKKLKKKDRHVLGVISDTHGTLTREAVRALNKVDLIIHAGDIDGPDVLKTLRDIAPVVAVRGNMDRGGWTRDLARAEVVQVGPMAVYVIHDVSALDLDPASAGFMVVVSGHTHRPSIKKKQGVLYVNPGSAWWPRGNHSATVAIVTVDSERVSAKLIELQTESIEE
jgi:putative phosphoesterase